MERPEPFEAERGFIQLGVCGGRRCDEATSDGVFGLADGAAEDLSGFAGCDGRLGEELADEDLWGGASTGAAGFAAAGFVADVFCPAGEVLRAGAVLD